MYNLLQRLKVFSGIVLILLFPVSLTVQVFSNGRITDTIRCHDRSDQSYTLFLPSTFTAKEKWPVILIFDPGGQGVVAVKAFVPAAERYGYILACSHNSRNGPLNNNFNAAGYLLNDLSKRFPIDSKRIYAAGFSGGSRFALALASSNEFIAGVIGCGAGLPGENNLYPSGRSVFIYYGMAGNRDMNYLEMFDLMTFFKTKTQVIYYLRTFDGGHQWPSPELLQEAVEWIELQTIKKKIIATDTTFVSYSLHKTRSIINNFISEVNLVDAERYMRYTIRDFSGLHPVNDLVKSLSDIDHSKQYLEESNNWLNISSRERKMNQKYVSSIREIMYSGYASDSVTVWWKNEVGSLKTMKEKSKPPISQMASRLLNFISILCAEQGMAFYRQKQYDLSGFLFKVCTLSDSENKNNYYNLARALAFLKKNREAVDALTRAVDFGLAERKIVDNEPAFDILRNDEKFRTLLLKLK
jgi:predicted esterase